MRVIPLTMVLLALSGCGQQLAGTAYKVEVGRQVTSWFDEEAATTWKAAAEFRFDVKR